MTEISKTKLSGFLGLFYFRDMVSLCNPGWPPERSSCLILPSAETRATTQGLVHVLILHKQNNHPKKGPAKREQVTPNSLCGLMVF